MYERNHDTVVGSYPATQAIASTSAEGSEELGALARYFQVIEWTEGLQVLSRLNKNYARVIGETLYQLQHSEKIAERRFNETVETLYLQTENVKLFSFANFYSLVARALGYPSYVEARQALNHGRGWLKLKPHRRGALELGYFAPSPGHLLPQGT